MLPSLTSARSLFLQVCRPSIAAAKSLVQPLNVHARTFASVLPSTPVVAGSSNAPSAENDGPLRPHLGIKVNPNHGLYAFFRKTVKDDGEVVYDTLEGIEPRTKYSGRAWTAPELRRKSFKDLHTLWYILVRERNLLATQWHELKRMRGSKGSTLITQRSYRVRKSMARIKYVINERRLAYEGALKIHEDNRLQLLAGKRERRAEHQARLDAIAEEERKARAEEEVKELQEQQRLNEGPRAADMAAAGLLNPVDTQTPSSSESHEKSS